MQKSAEYGSIGGMQITPDLQQEILRRLVAGETMRQILPSLGIDRWSYWQFKNEHPDFAAQVARAEVEGIDSQTDRLATVYEEENMRDAQRARGISENIKWLASKRHMARYGDRQELIVNQPVDIGSAILQARKRSSVPICDQSEHDEAQGAEYTVISDGRARGCEPQDSEPGEDDGVDIFS